MNLKRMDHTGTTGRFTIIGLLVLAMYIPLALVDGVTAERQSYFHSTLNDVASTWGGEQLVSGPYLVIPEVARREEIQLIDGVPVRVKQRGERIFLPGQLRVQASVSHQIRRRALYEVPVYTAVIRVQGEFPALDPEYLNQEKVRACLEQARFVLGISHTRAIGSASSLTLGDRTGSFESGTGQEWLGSGIQAALADYDGSQAQAFSFELELKGSRALGLTPVGSDSRIDMTSTWPHPSFTGQYLPETYQIGSEGFTAHWTVNELARNLPASWHSDVNPTQLADATASVGLFQPVTDYSVIDRAIKYGVLFIALTFLGFVCFELTLDLRFHPVQYGVVGVGLVLFYLALLSLSEHLPFAAAYGVSTALLTGLIGWYVRSMTGSRRLMLWIAFVVAGLYGVLYVLLQLEAFALLVGTGVLFLGLGALMFSTRSLTERG